MALLSNSAVPLLLGVIFNIPGFNSTFQNRLSAVSLLSKFLWNPIKGSETFGILRRFLPDPVVALLRSKSGTILSAVLDTTSETPELIWTAEMQTEVRRALMTLLCLDKGQEQTNEVQWCPVIPPDFLVNYRQIAAELYIGGVYVRLFLQQPTYLLSNPVSFLEGLIARWEESFEAQVPDMLPDVHNHQSVGQGAESESYAMVLGKEDFLSLITSAMVCVIKAETSLVDHLMAWGFADKSIELLRRALDRDRRGVPVTCVTRLLHQVIDRSSTADALAAVQANPVLQLTRVLDETDVILGGINFSELTLPKEAAFIVELLRKLFTYASQRSLQSLCSAAVTCKLPFFIADGIIARPTTHRVFTNVRNPSALRVHCVDLLKVISGNEMRVQDFLDQSSAWKEFSHQNHDLFITEEERTDPILIEDSSEKRFVGLLTDGVHNESVRISPHLTSTGRIPSPPSMRGHFGENTSKDDGSESKSDPFSASPSIPSKLGRGEQEQQRNVEKRELNRGSKERENGSKSQSYAARQDPLRALQEERDRANATTAVKKSVVSVSSLSIGNEIVVKVVKGKYGVGLDLCKGADGRAMVQKLKAMPAGVANPCLVCEPCVHAGDVIVSVNGEKCDTFLDTVQKIKSSEGTIVFALSRTF